MLGKIFETKHDYKVGIMGNYTIPKGFKVKIVDTNTGTNRDRGILWDYKLEVLNDVCNKWKKGSVVRIDAGSLNAEFKEIIKNSIKKI